MKLNSKTIEIIKNRIGHRSLILIGLMGTGKTTIGMAVSQILNRRFYDSDQEIEALSQMKITEFFSLHGEKKFRELEQEMIFHLLEKSPIVLATGGGAFINPKTRSAIASHGLSIWLHTDLDLLMKRVLRKNSRPLLQTKDPRQVMETLIKERYPLYAQADITLKSHDVHYMLTAHNLIKKVNTYLITPK